jgi:SAM-dependent methyltransferase
MTRAEPGEPPSDAPTPRSSTDPAVLEAAWAERVRANREQAERFRETQAGDFYAPVSSLFVADPRRTGEAALDVLAEQAGSNETWLDIGAGAGRYALPLALRVKEVIAVEPSAGMRRALRTGMDEHGIGNVRIVPGAWPAAAEELGDLPAADVALIAHVGYDIEAIGPFLDAMERAARNRCLAVLTDRSPASVADPFWPLVHGEDRVPLPALPDLLELLLARGREPLVTVAERSPRSFESVGALTAFLRRQLFIAEGGEKDLHFRAILPDHIARRDGAWTLADPPQGSLGIVTWRVGGGAASA